MAGVAVGALVVVSAIGVSLGWGPQVLEHDSQSSDAATSSAAPTTTQSSASVPTSVAPTTDATNEQLAAPPQRQETTTTDAPPPAPGPNTFTIIPGLPPVVVPTLPPLFPAPAAVPAQPGISHR